MRVWGALKSADGATGSDGDDMGEPDTDEGEAAYADLEHVEDDDGFEGEETLVDAGPPPQMIKEQKPRLVSDEPSSSAGPSTAG